MQVHLGQQSGFNLKNVHASMLDCKSQEIQRRRIYALSSVQLTNLKRCQVVVVLLKCKPVVFNRLFNIILRLVDISELLESLSVKMWD